MSKRNSYEREATKRGLLGIATKVEETKGQLVPTLAETGTALILGGVFGSLAGHVIGRPSLALGFLTTGASYYFGSRLGTTFGIGMMSAGYVSGDMPGVNGKLNGMDTMKERARLFADGLKARLYLDKVLKKQEEEGASGLGEVRYFVYPSDKKQAPMDMSALDRLQMQVEASAQAYAQKQQAQGQPMSATPVEQEYYAVEDRIL